MGYGLEFYGANGQLIFDSDNFGDAEVLTPAAAPTTTSNAITVAKDDLLFARVNSGNLRGSVTYSNNNTQKTFTPAQSTKYFVAKKTSTITNISGSGDYGLEIKSASGAITFSTRRADSAVNIQKIYDDKELTHGDTVHDGSPANIYVSISHMFYASPGNNTMGCYVFNSDEITFDSNFYISFLSIGNISIPNFGSVLVASLRG